jgi:selenocysteine lyase/cysteine desulfurase
VHGFGVEDVAVSALGCDVFVTGTHKWLFGPRGTGLLWARREVWPRFAPIIPTFTGPSIGAWFTGERTPLLFGLDATPGGYHSFEHRWAVTEAFSFHERIGKERVAEWTRNLAIQLKDGLAEIPSVRLITPRDPALSSGIVCCNVDGVDPGAVLQSLWAEHNIIVSVTPYREQFVRFGPSIVTTPKQVDDAVRAVAGIA